MRTNRWYALMLSWGEGGMQSGMHFLYPLSIDTEENRYLSVWVQNFTCAGFLSVPSDNGQIKWQSFAKELWIFIIYIYFRLSQPSGAMNGCWLRMEEWMQRWPRKDWSTWVCLHLGPNPARTLVSLQVMSKESRGPVKRRYRERSHGRPISTITSIGL